MSGTAELLAERDAEIARLREDAERWEKLVELWHASTELQLTQDEDGWSITVIEAVEAEPAPGRWTGDTPDEAIDALAAPKDRSGR